MQRSQIKNSMLLRNYVLCVTVIKIVKKPGIPPTGTRSNYDHHLNIWAIVQKPNLHTCLYVFLPFPFSPGNPSFLFVTSPISTLMSVRLEAPSSQHPPAGLGFQTQTQHHLGRRLKLNQREYTSVKVQINFENSVKYKDVCFGSKRISENRKEPGKFMEKCPNRARKQCILHEASKKTKLQIARRRASKIEGKILCICLVSYSS